MVGFCSLNIWRDVRVRMKDYPCVIMILSRTITTVESLESVRFGDASKIVNGSVKKQ